MAGDVVMISVDDLFNVAKFRDAFGVKIQTPNMDRLAAMGVTFENAYASTALCNESRTGVMTSTSAMTNGVHNNEQDWEAFVDPATTLPAIMRDAGFYTAAFGKNFHSLSADARAQLFDTASGGVSESHNRDAVTVNSTKA